MAFQIPIHKNGKTTLLTGGKFCPEDIDINVAVPVRAYSRYTTFADALSDGAKSDSGIFGGYSDEDGVRHVVLLDDYSSAVSISVQTDSVIHLNGHTLKFTNATAQLEVNTADTVIIDGTVVGSKMKKEVTSEINGTTRIINLNYTDLTINGGEYFEVVSGGGSGAAQIVSVGKNAKGFSMNGCSVSLTNNSTGNTKCVQAQSPITILNCKFSSVNNRGGEVAESTNSKSVICVHAATGDVLVENCEMVSKVYTKRMDSICLLSGGTTVTTVKNCNMYADGIADIDPKLYFVSCVRTDGTSTATVYGGHYRAAREAVSTKNGTIVRIDGGTYEGTAHGGAYFSCNSYAKNATFRGVKYTGDCGWDKQNTVNYFSACYCGTSSGGSNSYFDNCRFELDGSGASGLVAKYTNTNVYLSNIVFRGGMAYDLRVDAGDIIYIGENVDYDGVQPPQEGTDLGHGTVDTTTYAGHNFAW